MDALFLKIVNMSIAASWLILAVILLRVVLKKAPKWINVLLWGIVAFRLMCPFSFESSLSLIPSKETIPLDIGMDTTPAINSGINAINNAVNPIISQSNTPVAGASINPLQITIGLFEYLWILGIMVMLIYAAVSYFRLQRKAGASLHLRDNIWICDDIQTPFILGAIKPRIYIPSGTNEAQLPHIIAHENAHLKRRDHWWKPLGFLMLTIHWFNPLVWVAYILLCRDIELACDEKVIRDLNQSESISYSEALLSCSVNRRTIMVCPLAFGEVGVKERVKRVLNYKKPAFWIVVVAVVACVVLAVCLLTNPSQPKFLELLESDEYVILQEDAIDITLTVPKDALSEDCFTSEGREFEAGEVPVYQTKNTTIYLHHVMLSNESDEQLYFIFDFSHDLSSYGKVLSSVGMENEDGLSAQIHLRSKDLKDGKTTYPDALNLRAHGPGTQFAFYVSTDAVKAIKEEIKIDVTCSEIVYAKLGYEDDAKGLIVNTNAS